MILRLIKNNQAIHFITIPLIVLVLWFRNYISPDQFHFFVGEDQMLLYHPLKVLTAWSPLASNLLAIVFALIIGFLVLRLNSSYSFIAVRTFLPSYVMILILSGLVSTQSLHPVFLGAIFLMLAIDRIFDSYEKKKIISNAFDSGFLIGLGSLCYFNLIFFFPITWISFILIRKSFKGSVFLLALIGLALPWLYAFSYYFLTDQLAVMEHIIVQNVVTSNKFFGANLPFQIYLGYLIFLTLIGSFFLLSQLDEKKVSSRKYFQIFFIVFIIATLMLVLIPAVSHEILVIIAIPLTFLFSNYLIFMRRQFWGNLFIYLLIGLVIYMQFI